MTDLEGSTPAHFAAVDFGAKKPPLLERER